ncbi:MAG: hypothetical protein RLZZ185_865 [Bacteroidota bacterium]|jgi:hypothetical protein
MKNQFEIDRNISITDEEFHILILTYPIFLVANSDNNFADNEKVFLITILKNFIESAYRGSLNNEEIENLTNNYIEDFEFLVQNETKYKKEFLNILKSYGQEIRHSIKDLILEIAEISDGISIEEKLSIDEINEYLS